MIEMLPCTNPLGVWSFECKARILVLVEGMVQAPSNLVFVRIHRAIYVEYAIDVSSFVYRTVLNRYIDRS